MSNIKRLKDKDGNYIYPVTHASAVFDTEGKPFSDLRDEVVYARGDSVCLNDRLNNFDSQLKQNNEDVSILNDEKINVLRHGIIPNDSSVDNSIKFQELLDILSETGGRIYFPKGDYYFKSNISIPENVAIEGCNKANRGVNSSKSTNFIFQPETKCDFISLKKYDYYSYGITIEKIKIICNDNSNVCLDLRYASYTIIEDIAIVGGNTCVLVGSTMFLTVNNVTCTDYLQKGIYITNHSGLSTTTIFNECYCGQTYVRGGAGRDEYLTAIPLYIERNAITDCTFNSFTMEATEKGAYIDYGNHIIFNDLYVECVPTSQVDYVIHYGTNLDNATMPTETFNRGELVLNGGRILSSNWLPPNTEGLGILNIDVCNIVSVNNMIIMNSNNLIKYTNNMKGAMFTNCSLFSITHGFDEISNSKVKILNCKGTQEKILNKLDSIKMPNSSGGGYEINSIYSYTNGDLIFSRFSNPSANTLWLDANSNVSFNFKNSPGLVGETCIVGPSTVPGNLVYLKDKGCAFRTEIIDGTPQLVYYNGNQTSRPLTLIGDSDSRPKTCYQGLQYYDTTINKPIWWNGSNWIDSSGTQV